MSNNKDVKYIVVLLPFSLTGVNGSIYHFKPFRQCEYVSEGYLIEDDPMYYFEVNLCGDTYLVPNTNVYKTTRKHSEDEQLSPAERKDKEQYDKTVKDHKKETLKVLGIDIKKNERADFNGRWLAKLLRKH